MDSDWTGSRLEWLQPSQSPSIRSPTLATAVASHAGVLHRIGRRARVLEVWCLQEVPLADEAGLG